MLEPGTTRKGRENKQKQTKKQGIRETKEGSKSNRGEDVIVREAIE